jgi:hypothetical protein
MHITAAAPGPLSYQDPRVVPPGDRLAGAKAADPASAPETQDIVGDAVQRILRDKMWAMIMGADEEESGIPPLDYEL